MGLARRRASILVALAGVLLVSCSSGPAREASMLQPSPGASSPAEPIVAAPGAMTSGRDHRSPIDVKREAWEFAGVAGQRIVSPHFRVHTTVVNKYLLEQIPLYLEGALVQYTTALAQLPPPREPLESYIFGSRRQWEAKTRQMLPEQAKTYLNLGRGGFTTRGIAVLYDIDVNGASDTLAITAHEGWHQYTQRMFANPLPVWLEEGIASYMEGHSGFQGESPTFLPWKNRERFDALRSAARRERLLPLSELLKRSPQAFLDRSNEELLGYYAQVWALTHFLVEGEGGKYRAGLSELLKDAAAGRMEARLASGNTGRGSQRQRGVSRGAGLTTAIAQEYFNRDTALMESEYARFIHAITTAPGARSSIQAGRSPLAGMSAATSR